MRLVDSNHDDQISYDELLGFAKENSGALFRVQKPISLILDISIDEKANLIFDSYDDNNDDVLTQREVEKLFQDTYGYVNCQNLYDFFSEIDSDSDSIITYKEMLTVEEVDSSQ